MATLGVRSRSPERSLGRRMRLNDAMGPKVRAQDRTLLRVDKLGVTGSSPVLPTSFRPTPPEATSAKLST